MNCQQAQVFLQDDLDELLNSRQRADFQKHLQYCLRCKSLFDQWLEIKHELRRLPRQNAPANLASQILQERARKQNKKRWFRGAGAVSIAAALSVVSFTLNENFIKPNSVPEISSQAAQSQQVNFLVNSERQLEQVRFDLKMPKNVYLQGYKNRTKLSWHGRLQKGDNLLKLPVISLEPEPGILTLRIQHGDAMKEIKVKINSQT